MGPDTESTDIKGMYTILDFLQPLRLFRKTGRHGCYDTTEYSVVPRVANGNW